MMKLPDRRQILYSFCAILVLLYVLAGLFISLNAGAQSTNAGFQASYQVGSDSMSLGLFILITGIPMFILFAYLQWRTGRMRTPNQ